MQTDVGEKRRLKDFYLEKKKAASRSSLARHDDAVGGRLSQRTFVMEFLNGMYRVRRHAIHTAGSDHICQSGERHSDASDIAEPRRHQIPLGAHQLVAKYTVTGWTGADPGPTPPRRVPPWAPRADPFLNGILRLGLFAGCNAGFECRLEKRTGETGIVMVPCSPPGRSMFGGRGRD